MLTPEDLELARRLRAAGLVDADALARHVASIFTVNAGRPLADVLRAAGLPHTADWGSQDAGAATHDPGPAAPQAASAQPAAGGPARRLGRYEILEEVARGGMGVVYRAREPGLNRTVAIKVLLEGERARADLVERFQREARAAAGLSHPNIVPIYEVGEDAGVHWFAMEFVEGTALDKLLKREGALPPRVALRIARDLARALQHAHDRGIVHRDVKPGNVLLAAESSVPAASRDWLGYRVLLGDFGLAKDAGGPSLTVSGSLIGTPAYMSPEQAGERVSEIEARSDVYSLGAVLYEMLAGRPPFSGATLGEMLSAIESADPAPVRSLRPGVHRDVELVVLKAMAKEKDRRYATAGALADDIERYLNGEAILAAPPTLVYRAGRFARRNRAAVAAALVCVLVAAGFGGSALSRRLQEEAGRRRRAAEHLEAAARQREAGRFDDALIEIGLAESLAPGTAAAARARADTRVAQCEREVEALAAQGNWDGARGVLAAFSEVRDRPEVRALARRVAGTGTLEVGLAAPGIEVDIGPADPGVLWDEESFPPLDAARQAGLCRPLGAAPLPRRDLDFGDWLVVLSRGGRVERVVPLRLPRSADAFVELRLARVGAPEFPTLEAALSAARPGWIVELPGGDWSAPAARLGPGVLLRPVPGERAVFRGGGKDAVLDARGAHGAALRDLEFRDGTGTGVAFSGAFRPSILRCRFRDIARSSLDLGGAEDWTAADVVIERPGEVGLDASGSRRGTALRVSTSDGGWAGIVADAAGVQAARCTSARTRRAGFFFRGAGHRLVESEALGCAEWGVIVPDGRDVVIRDCVFSGCAGQKGTGSPVVVALGAVIGSEVAHNTVSGGEGLGIAFGEKCVRARLTDNIVAGTADAAFYWHGGGDTAVIDGNLVWNCRAHGRIWEIEAATLQEFREAPQRTGFRSWKIQAQGLEADPRFRDAAGGDFRLADDSPARGSATDGTDRGARRTPEAAAEPSAAWLRRDNARVLEALAKEAEGKGDAPGAARLRRAAEGCGPGGR